MQSPTTISTSLMPNEVAKIDQIAKDLDAQAPGRSYGRAGAMRVMLRYLLENVDALGDMFDDFNETEGEPFDPADDLDEE